MELLHLEYSTLYMKFFLSTFIVEYALAVNTQWAAVMTQKDKAFSNPYSSTVIPSHHECAVYCHKLSTTVKSFTHHADLGTCNCYEVNYQNGGEHEVLTGTLLFKKVAGTSCLDLYNQGTAADGVYSVTTLAGQTFSVYCDMQNGGWTVIQHRNSGTEPFNRNWNDYKNGFGSLTSEFWLGLDKIHWLTSNPTTVRFDLQRTDNKWIHLEQNGFSVGDAASKYVLSLGSLVSRSSEMCDTTFSYNKNYRFYTHDDDNGSKCAQNRKGGWWFRGCTWININGQYGLYNSMTGFTEHCSGFNNLKVSYMKIK